MTSRSASVAVVIACAVAACSARDREATGGTGGSSSGGGGGGAGASAGGAGAATSGGGTGGTGATLSGGGGAASGGTAAGGGGATGGGGAGSGGGGASSGGTGGSVSCNPVNPPDPNGWKACSAGQTCVPGYSAGLASYCSTSANKPPGAACTYGEDNECTPGHGCDGTCRHWCASFADCPGGTVGCYLNAPAYVGYAVTKKFGLCK